MKQFLDLIQQIDSTTSTNEKVHWIAKYFSNASPADAAWALFFLTGKRFKRLISSLKLREWCLQETKIPHWLFVESHAQVGDTAEVISLLIKGDPSAPPDPRSFDEWMNELILPLKTLPEEEQKKIITDLWHRQSYHERFVMNKILAGSFRIGVSYLLTVQGLSKAYQLPTSALNIRLAGDWEPTQEFFKSLISQDQVKTHALNPYPFFLASPFEGDLNELGDPGDWLAEWKWDGIRAQIICREGQTAIWSRGKDLITPSFPELFNESLLNHSFVFDGEILAYEKDRPRPFADLQKRLGRKKVSANIQKQYPVALMIYDLLEWDGEDLRHLPFEQRRQKLTELFPKTIHHPQWYISPALSIKEWSDVPILKAQAEGNMTEGLVLKKKNSHYGIGRRRGSWWKYKIDPMTVDAILIYAQPGSGYRSGLYTDYTFGVWDEGVLVPVAKAYSGLTQEEINQMDKWIRKNTIEKFGPVRSVKPEQVFEIAFENIQLSNRHKAGLALRFPRIKRWRTDKTADMADDLNYLKDLYHKRSSYE
jgi:DNA ligase 1